MKIFVTGASGMLAADVIPELLRLGHDVLQSDIVERLPSIMQLDITNRDDVLSRIREHKPDFIFHLGAETNVDLCEEKPEHAFKVNAEGTGNVVEACKVTGAKLLYISTGSVFYGDEARPYTEDDKTHPLNEYAKSKLEGERIIQDQLKEYFIVRAGWMVGGWELDKKFVYKIVQQIRGGKKELQVVSDKRGSPTFTKDFAANIMAVINSGKYGVYHLANKGTCSRYEMALKIVEYMDKKDEVKVNEIGSDKYPLPAPRPDSEMISNTRLDAMGINNMPTWEESLREYIVKNKDSE